MDTPDEHHELTDDIHEATHRARAREMLDQITRQVKLALSQQGIDLDLFFVIPSSESLLCYGTMSDPTDELWGRVSRSVSSIVRGAVGLERVRCRPVMCATTESITDHPTDSPAQPSEPSGCQPVPMPASALQHAGAEVR